MAKKTISKIAAIALAGATMISTMSIVASAATNELKVDVNGKLVGDVYKVITSAPDANGIPVQEIVHYTTAAAAGSNYTTVDVSTLGSTVYVKDGKVYTEKIADSTEYKTASTSTNSTTGKYTIPPSYRTASDRAYYCDANDTWYPNLESYKAARGNTNYTISQLTNYSSTYCYFDPVSGYYVTETQKSVYPHAVYVKPETTTNTTNDASSVYKVNDKYYPSYSAAYSAANGKTHLIKWVSDYTTLPSKYFSNITGEFYPTYASALEASKSKSEYVVTFDSYYNYIYGDYYDYYDYYGYYGYLNGYYYGDPNYYYWLMKYNSSSNSKDTTTATVGNKKGWTSIASYLKRVSSGSSITVDMNKETEVPSSVLSAIDGRNVTVKFVLDNGVTFTVNGKDVTSAKDVDLNTTYSTQNISSKLVKAAYKKNNGVSSAQITIDAGSLGFTSDLTVKFNAKRSGCNAKLYRYNASKNSLQLVDAATIDKNGKCTFDNVTKGGEFVIVLYK